MSKERLERIEARFKGFDFELKELGEDFDWLIEQAERVHELEKLCEQLIGEEWMSGEGLYESEMMELERVNKQLKNNLSVYKGYYKNTLKINEDVIEENKKVS